MKSRNLEIIQKLSNIGRILSKIIKICSIIGAIGCFVGILYFNIFGGGQIAKIGNISIISMVQKDVGMSTGTMYANMVSAMIVCIGQFIIALMSERFFKHELEVGTPFDEKVAEEIKKLGIYTICISIGGMIVASICCQIINQISGSVADIGIDNYASVGFGITFIILSVIFKYGSELR